ncbi:MAG TPA: glycosyltransferase family 2 protein [Chryseobacterium sp.]|nr:glycosyltransferase family 2 protein [Chryseobacterium sp.]
MQKKVYIIILNYKTWKDSIECLESVFLLDYSNFQVVLVDNFSQNGSIEEIQSWASTYEVNNFFEQKEGSKQPVIKRKLNFSIYEFSENYNSEINNTDLIIIKGKENKGFSAGNNIGLKYALQRNDFDFVWLLNNDTIVEKNALTELTKHLNLNPEIGICGSVLLDYIRPNILQGVGGYYNKITGSAKEIFNGRYLSRDLFAIPHKINYPIGASLFLQKKFLETVGLLNEEYFLFFEEIDWTLRGEKFGWICGYAPESYVWHKGSSTINSNSKKSKVSDYFGVRSKILFTKKFYPKNLIFIYACFLPLLINRIKRGQFNRLVTILSIMLNPKMDYKEILSK